MKNILKKSLTIFSVFALSFGMIGGRPVFAESNLDIIYEKEISESIISGDGSAENPYILNSETSPMFTQYLEQKGKEALSNNLYSDHEISTYGVLDGVLSGTSHSGQSYGGYWKYSYGAPNVSVNGNIWMEKVEYLSLADVKNICADFTSSSVFDTFKGSITSIAGGSLTSGINYLTGKG